MVCWSFFFVEDTDGNSIAPFEASVQGFSFVSVVVSFFLEFVDSFFKPVPSVQVVEGYTGLQDIEEGKAFMLDGFHDELGQVSDLSNESSCYECSIADNSMGDGV